jgi:hypothetical protein
MKLLIFTIILSHYRSRDSSVAIATGYGMKDGGVGVRVPIRQEFSLLHVVQTGSGVHTTYYTMGTRDSFHSPTTSAEFKKIWIYTPTPHTPSWRSVSLVKHRNNFTFTFYYMIIKFPFYGYCYNNHNLRQNFLIIACLDTSEINNYSRLYSYV